MYLVVGIPWFFVFRCFVSFCHDTTTAGVLCKMGPFHSSCTEWWFFHGHIILMKIEMFGSTLVKGFQTLNYQRKPGKDNMFKPCCLSVFYPPSQSNRNKAKLVLTCKQSPYATFLTIKTVPLNLVPSPLNCKNYDATSHKLARLVKMTRILLKLQTPPNTSLFLTVQT